MKKLLFLALATLLIGSTFSSCKGKTESQKINDSLAVTMGQLAGSSLRQEIMMNPQLSQIKLDKDEFLKGVISMINMDTTSKSISYLAGQGLGQNIYGQIQGLSKSGISIDRRLLIDELKKAFNSKKEINQDSLYNEYLSFIKKSFDAKGQEFIDEQMKKDSGYKKTKSGIAYKVVKEGSGNNFTDNDVVDVEYTVKDTNGKETFSTKGNTNAIDGKSAIPGFKEVLKLMKPGSKVIAIIPGDLLVPEREKGIPQQKQINPQPTFMFEFNAAGLHKDEKAQ